MVIVTRKSITSHSIPNKERCQQQQWSPRGETAVRDNHTGCVTSSLGCVTSSLSLHISLASNWRTRIWSASLGSFVGRSRCSPLWALYAALALEGWPTSSMGTRRRFTTTRSRIFPAATVRWGKEVCTRQVTDMSVQSHVTLPSMRHN